MVKWRIQSNLVQFNQRALCFNKREPLFDRRELGLSRRAGGGRILPNWKLFWRLLIQIKKKFFFSTRWLFNEASNPWMLYLSKIGPALKPCMNLKSENVNMGTAGKNFWIFKILHFKMGKWTESENEVTYPPPPPPNEIKNILTPSPLKNPKFQNSNSP